MSDKDPLAPLTALPNGPYQHGADLTPNDTVELAVYSSALMATTTAGKVTVVSVGGETFNVYLPLGVAVPVRAKIVKAAGLTAAGITALW